MARKSYVQINGKLYDKAELSQLEAADQKGPFIAPDQPDFVSPIDGRVYSGRAGLRDHCARHNVVPNLELKGLPPQTLHHGFQPSASDRESTKRTIAEILNSRRYA